MAEQRYGGGLLDYLQGMDEPEEVETFDLRQPDRWYDYYRPILAQPGQRYYMIGTRPLDVGISSASRASAASASRNNSKEGYHHQLVRDDGYTFGYGLDNVFEEKGRPYAFDSWRFGDMKFNAALVDEARQIHAERVKAGLIPSWSE